MFASWQQVNSTESAQMSQSVRAFQDVVVDEPQGFDSDADGGDWLRR